MPRKMATWLEDIWLEITKLKTRDIFCQNFLYKVVSCVQEANESFRIRIHKFCWPRGSFMLRRGILSPKVMRLSFFPESFGFKFSSQMTTMFSQVQ